MLIDTMLIDTNVIHLRILFLKSSLLFLKIIIVPPKFQHVNIYMLINKADMSV